MLSACTAVCLAGPIGIADGDEPAVAFSEAEIRKILQHSPLPEPPPDPTNRVADDPAAASFGQSLFFEKRFSANGEISCATCHAPDKSFADAKALGEGMETLSRHTPSLWNVAYNRWFFWDGRADTLWSQAVEPMENPHEVAGSRLQVARIIHDDPHLSATYTNLFGRLPAITESDRFPIKGRPVPDNPEDPDHVAWSQMADDDRLAIDQVFVNAAKAIAAYERKLVSRRSPFDVFAEGLRDDDEEKRSAIPAPAQRGLKLFIGRGQCRLCHSGPTFTDGEFHSIRIAPRDGGPPRDAGRYEGIAKVRSNPFNAASIHSDEPAGSAADKVRFLAGNPETWGTFKTPSLRNVARTAPYMHQGQLATLEEVVHFYSTFEGSIPPGHHEQEDFLVPLKLSAQEQADLIAFLESLTDENLDPRLMIDPTAASSEVP